MSPPSYQSPHPRPVLPRKEVASMRGSLPVLLSGNSWSSATDRRPRLFFRLPGEGLDIQFVRSRDERRSFVAPKPVKRFTERLRSSGGSELTWNRFTKRQRALLFITYVNTSTQPCTCDMWKPNSTKPLNKLCISSIIHGDIRGKRMPAHVPWENLRMSHRCFENTRPSDLTFGMLIAEIVQK